MCRHYCNETRNERYLSSLLSSVVDRWRSIDEDETRESFRSDIQSYSRLYGYLSQIITFTDLNLEKSYLFLSNLNRCLDRRDTNEFSLSDYVDLESLRIQKQHEKIEELTEEESVVSHPDFETNPMGEPEKDLLSEIIDDINKKYGDLLNDEDRIDLGRIEDKIQSHPDLRKVMTSDNSPDNKQSFFGKVFDDELSGYINKRFEFFQKMDHNPEVKSFIRNRMFSEYVTS